MTRIKLDQVHALAWSPERGRRLARIREFTPRRVVCERAAESGLHLTEVNLTRIETLNAESVPLTTLAAIAAGLRKDLPGLLKELGF
ncbi:hypothetical protein H6F46_11870 [Limnothrix sp. FACHB-1083]|uniref:hypothetical protein n=1 Tax=unclassified Limnothrix TaxID=2632864 RepID=UPI0016818955|nr:MULTISPECIES: hypothetical protein [unclassified Limnothrix]MBD2161387.1 hypothetical protein [Limnothrix sp. FACHB-1083]MBD2192101.1 hypothetical protein [Limnothrix sp. FACHB-1088]